MVTALDNRTALILIDLQQGIVSRPVAHPREQVLGNVARLIAAFRQYNLPVVVVTVDPAGAVGRKPPRVQLSFTRPTSGEGTPADFLALAPELVTRPDDIFITKHTWSAFHKTPLHDQLQSLGITGIVLAGISTSIGVEGTARSASERGYNLTFPSDAMTDLVPLAHENSIERIFPRLGEIGTTDEVIALLPNRTCP
jgi:nicotinamidase-related amidase